LLNKKRSEKIAKKQYEQPKAEKLEFNYQEVVVASGGQSDVGPICDSKPGPHPEPVKPEVKPEHKPPAPGPGPGKP